MNKLKMFVIAVALFLIACDVNFGDLAVPNNEASYTIKLIDEQYDIATEMLKYAEGVSKDNSGALCVDTTIVYNESSGIAFSKTSFSSIPVCRIPPYFLSDIDSKSFSFVLEEINYNIFNTLSSGSTSLSFNGFKFTGLNKNNSTNLYTEFNSANVSSAELRVTATNNLGFAVDSLIVTVCDSSGNTVKTLSIGKVLNGASASSTANISSADNIKYTQYISIKAEGWVDGQTSLYLNASNNLLLKVSFDTITASGSSCQILASDYFGYAQEDTVSINWKQAFNIDKDNDGSVDFDIYTFNSTSSTNNKLSISCVTYCDDNVNASFVFPGSYVSSTRNDTLSRDITIYKADAGSSATRTNSLSFASRYFGEAYSTGSSLFDSIKVIATFVFPKSSKFVQVSEEKINVSLTLDSLEVQEMICKVKEDVVFGGVSGSVPVSLNRFYVTDKDGKEVSEVNLVGSSDISFTMNRIIKTQNSSSLINDFIRVKVDMNSSRNSNIRSYNDSLSFGISPSLLISYTGSLPNDTSFLNLLKILPENFTYSIKPTVKASDSVIVINASNNLSLNVNIKSPIKFDTEGENLVFELRKDYGNGFEGMYKEFTSAQLTNSVYNNYISGNLVLNYKNTSNMTLGAKVIFSTDKSVLYNDSIITTATTSTVGTSGYPSYIARVISLSDIQPNISSGKVSTSLTKNDLVPFLQDKCYVGVKIPIKSSSASFSGELDLVGKIQFDYNNFGDL